MSLKGSRWQISPAEKELTTGSNCSGKQRQAIILKMQLSKKTSLTSKKASLSFPYLSPLSTHSMGNCHIDWINCERKSKVGGGGREIFYILACTCVFDLLQGAKKVIFKACHSGKLKLAYTEAQMSFQLTRTLWWAELISQFFCNLNSSKNSTWPSGELRTEFTSPITKSTIPGLSDTTFFARCADLTGLLSLWLLTLLNFHSTKFNFWYVFSAYYHHKASLQCLIIQEWILQ